MILKSIISHLNGKITGLGYFTKVFDLCELKEKGGKTSPMEYCSNGQYKEVFNIDYEKGLTYFRKRSDTSISEDERNTVVACETLSKIDYKLRLVAAVKKFPDKITDDNYSADRLAMLLFGELNVSEDRALKTLIKAREVSILVTAYSTNTKDILKSEFSGFDIKDLPDKYSFVSMDIDVSVTLSTKCLTQECI